MRAVLLSTYELGRQPFGLASPAAWLRRAGHAVACFDLSRRVADPAVLAAADLIGFYLPMHTATRLALEALPQIRQLNPQAHLCGFGLYAPLNASQLQAAGMHTVLSGEFEASLTALADRLTAGQRPDEAGASAARGLPAQHSGNLERLRFLVPDRSDLPPLTEYAGLVQPDGTTRVVGYTEASRGCKHHCRHCPIVPVYEGRFRVVQRDVVLADIRQQVAAGAEHITFGDPDFFNGIGHAAAIVRELHTEFPRLSYDVTIKIEHLLRHADHLSLLRSTGCVLVTSAVESFDDAVLALLDKGHTRADFETAVTLLRQHGLNLSPTFVTFTPWTTAESYCELLERLADLELIEQVAPIQLAVRLLVPAQSRLLELQAMRRHLDGFDAAALTWIWRHPDPRMDAFCATLQEIIGAGVKTEQSRATIFNTVWDAAHALIEGATRLPPVPPPGRATVPYLNEPWFC